MSRRPVRTAPADWQEALSELRRQEREGLERPGERPGPDEAPPRGWGAVPPREEPVFAGFTPETAREHSERTLSQRLLDELEREKASLIRSDESARDRDQEFERDRQRLLGDILESAEQRRARDLEEVERARQELEDQQRRDHQALRGRRQARWAERRSAEERERDQQEAEERLARWNQLDEGERLREQEEWAREEELRWAQDEAREREEQLEREQQERDAELQREHEAREQQEREDSLREHEARNNSWN